MLRAIVAYTVAHKIERQQVGKLRQRLCAVIADGIAAEIEFCEVRKL